MMHMHHSRMGKVAAPSSDLPCACTALRKAARAVSRLYEHELEAVGVTVTQFAILRTIERMEDPPLSRLAEAMVMDRTSLYRALSPMAREGWIVIEAGAGGRTKVVRLTGEGRAVIERAQPGWAASQAGFLEAFGRDEWAALAVTLQRVLGAAEARSR